MYTPELNPSRARRRLGFAWKIVLVLSVAAQVAAVRHVIKLEARTAALESSREAVCE